MNYLGCALAVYEIMVGSVRSGGEKVFNTVFMRDFSARDEHFSHMFLLLVLLARYDGR